MTDAEVMELGRRAGWRTRTRNGAVRKLLDQGGFLLVELGLVADANIMAGTAFMYDIFEYILYPVAAWQLAQGDDVIQVHFIGGDPARVFTRSALLAALRTTPEFDQLERKGSAQWL
jgi:hypothetical protein